MVKVLLPQGLMYSTVTIFDLIHVFQCVLYLTLDLIWMLTVWNSDCIITSPYK